MAFDINAIKAAAAKLQQAQQAKAQPKSEPKSAPKSASKKSAKATTSAPKSAPKADSPKTKGGASYVIPAEFKEAIESYLFARPDVVPKMATKGKSIDGCCDYIFDVMKKRAEKARNGKSAVGIYSKPDEIYGLAVHYYDESDEDLKNELNKKED